VEKNYIENNIKNTKVKTKKTKIGPINNFKIH